MRCIFSVITILLFVSNSYALLLGKNTIGASAGTPSAGYIFISGSYVAQESDASVSQIHMYASRAGDQVIVGVYDDNTGVPGNLVAESELYTVPAIGWQIIDTKTSFGVTSNETYWFAFLFPNADGRIPYDATGGKSSYYTSSGSYTSLPASAATGFTGPITREFSLYLEYGSPAQIFISNSGDDTTGDGSEGNPYRSIDKADSETPGYTCYIKVLDTIYYQDPAALDTIIDSSDVIIQPADGVTNAIWRNSETWDAVDFTAYDADTWIAPCTAIVSSTQVAYDNGAIDAYGLPRVLTRNLSSPATLSVGQFYVDSSSTNFYVRPYSDTAPTNQQIQRGLAGNPLYIDGNRVTVNNFDFQFMRYSSVVSHGNDVTFSNCNFNNMIGDAFLCDAGSVELIGCEAIRSSNDGFKQSGGTMILRDCIGAYNNQADTSDGYSFHGNSASCIIYVYGGHYYGNKKAGLAPAYSDSSCCYVYGAEIYSNDTAGIILHTDATHGMPYLEVDQDANGNRTKIYGNGGANALTNYTAAGIVIQSAPLTMLNTAIVRNVDFYDNQGNPNDGHPVMASISTEAGLGNGEIAKVEISDCTFSNENTSYIFRSLMPVHSLAVWNNLFNNDQAFAYSGDQYPHIISIEQAVDGAVENNTFYSSSSNQWVTAMQLEKMSNAQLTVKNSIFKNFKSAIYGGSANLTLALINNFNLYHNNLTNLYYNNAAQSIGANSLTNDPLFADAVTGDFSLQTNSPCVDAGSNSTWMVGATDLQGKERILNDIVDMGSIELIPHSWDSDTNGIPDWWEWDYSGSRTGMTASADLDNDDMDNFVEYVCRTDPLDANSFLGMTEIDQTVGDGYIACTWASVEGRSYSLYRGTNLMDGFSSLVASNIMATAPLNTYTDTTVTAETWFYRIEVE